MVTFSPPAFPLDGTEGIPLNVSGRGGTVTLAQLRQIVRGQPIGAGAPNPPVGQPAVTAISGTEQLRVMSGATGGCGIATVDQLIAWITRERHRPSRCRRTALAGVFAPSPRSTAGMGCSSDRTPASVRPP